MFGFVGWLVGGLFIILGIFLIFFFPSVIEHQPSNIGFTGIILGLIFLVVGGVLVFVN